AAIVADNNVVGGWLGAVALLLDLVLQSAGQRDDAVFQLICGEECVAIFRVGIGHGLLLGLVFGFGLLLQGGEDRFRLILGEQQLATAQHIVDSAQHDAGIDLDAVALEASSDAVADGVALLGLLRIECERRRALGRILVFGGGGGLWGGGLLRIGAAGKRDAGCQKDS